MKKGKWLGTLLMLLVFGVLTGCGSTTTDSGDVDTEQTTEKEKITMEARWQEELQPREVTQYVNFSGKQVPLSGSAIAEDCFFGEYYYKELSSVSLDNDAEVRKQFAYSKKRNHNGKEVSLSELPIKIEFGRGVSNAGKAAAKSLGFHLLISDTWENEKGRDALAKEYDEDIVDTVYHNYMLQRLMPTAYLIFAKPDTNSITGDDCEVLCTYTVQGDTIHFQEIETHLDYSFDPVDFNLDIQYNFIGTELELSVDGKKVVLGTKKVYTQDDPNTRAFLSIQGAAKGRDQIVDQIAFFWDNTNNGNERDSLYFADGSKAIDPKVDFGFDGNFVIQWDQVQVKSDSTFKTEDRPGKVTGQFIGMGTDKGMILIVDGKAYAYMMPSPYEANSTLLVDNVVSDKEIESLTDDELSNVRQKQQDAAARIQEALADETGIKLNEISGEVVFESGILFGYDESELGEEGKKALDTFLAKYAPVISELAENQVIMGVMISGYTDPQGKYTYNKTLSEKRAENVKNYITSVHPELDDLLRSEGRASEKPVLNMDGTVNNEACRRVTFDLIISSK